MKKAIAVLLAVLLMVGVLVGCGGTDTDNDGPTGGDHNPADTTIAIMMGGMNHPVHRIVQMAFLTAGEDMGYNAIIGGLDDGSAQELMTKYESVIANGCEGALLWSGDDTFYQFMRDMSEMCYFVVPHFAHEYVDTKNFISRNICAQAKEYGYKAGEFMLEKLAEAGITSGTIGNTQAGANVTENACSDAFRQAIKDSGANFKVADVVFEGLELSAASVKVVGIINSNPDIVAGFGTTGGSCQSWDLAMQQTQKRLIVVGVDYTEFNIDLVADGAIAGLVAQPLFEEGEESVKTLDALFRGETFADSAENWWLKCDAPVAYVGGEGASDIEYYRPFVDKVVEYYSE